MKKRKSKGRDGVNDEEVVAHKTAEARKGARTGFCKFLRFLGGKEELFRASDGGKALAGVNGDFFGTSRGGLLDGC